MQAVPHEAVLNKRPAEEMTSIMVPKLVGMDTSILIGIASGLCDAEPEHRRTAERFATDLSTRGGIPVICRENVVEMLRHPDENIVASRIRMFARFFQVAHVDSLRDPGRIGSVVDVLAREVREVLRDSTSDAASVAKLVRSDVVGFCDGATITRQLRETVDIVRPVVQEDQLRHKQLVSVSHLDVMGIGRKKVGSIDPAIRVDGNMISRYGAELRRWLEANLRSHGVKGVDHDAFASGLASHCEADLLASTAPEGSRSAGDLMNEWLETHGIDAAQIDGNTTVADIAKMACFNHKLKVASRVLGLADPVTVGDVLMNQCPSEVIWTGLDEQRRSAPRAQSGDLYDAHIACLASYCDLVIVDKRTRAYLEQFCAKNDLARRLVCRIVSLSKYADLLSVDF